MTDPNIPTIGRIVHFVMESGAHRPAIVTESLHDREVESFVLLEGKPLNTGAVNNPVALTVWPSLLDNMKNASGEARGTMVKCPVEQNEELKLPGTWHWPERS